MENSVSAPQDSNPYGYYASLISGSLLVISEILPYLSKVKGNGIIQVLTNLFTGYDELKKKEKAEYEQKIQDLTAKVNESLEILKRLEAR